MCCRKDIFHLWIDRRQHTHPHSWTAFFCSFPMLVHALWYVVLFSCGYLEDVWPALCWLHVFLFDRRVWIYRWWLEAMQLRKVFAGSVQQYKQDAGSHQNKNSLVQLYPVWYSKTKGILTGCKLKKGGFWPAINETVFWAHWSKRIYCKTFRQVYSWLH